MKKNVIKSLFSTLLNVVFPNHCMVCGTIIESYNPKDICLRCIQKELPYIHKDGYTRCVKCGRVLDDEKSICLCENESFYFDFSRHLLYYREPVINLIHAMKFSRRYLLCKDFGFIIAHYYKDYISSHDLILYIPLSKKRIKERGYNQSLILADTLSKVSGVPILYNAIHRKKDTMPLSLVSDHTKRKEIIKDAFSINFKDKLAGNSVLIVDDVFTTGATLNEAAKEIKKTCNIKCIGVFTIARTY